MRYHFFLHYGWFSQNLGKEAVRTFMHTTVCGGHNLNSPKNGNRVIVSDVPVVLHGEAAN